MSYGNNASAICIDDLWLFTQEMEMKLLESQQQLKSELVFSPFSFSLMCLCTDDNGSPSWPDSQSGYLCFD